MQIIKQTSEVFNLCAKWREENVKIALVPTMGFYHAGHESLMRYAREQAQKVIVSLFVNPMQFAPTEDLATYPRDIDRDASIAKALGVDALFIPGVEQIYPTNFSTVVALPQLSAGLCGKTRPTHFDGVATIVLKLFMLTQAHIAVFGQKDWQQLTIIKQMVHDLNIPIQILGRPIVREDDGLALSSRNIYLDKNERMQAPFIYKGLCETREMAAVGTDSLHLLHRLQEFFAKHIPLGKIDYASIVDANTLQEQNTINNESILACAMHLGKARLLDNIMLCQ